MTLGREQRLIVRQQNDGVLGGDVRGSRDDVAGPVEGGIELDAPNRTVRNRGPYGDAMQATWDVVVVDIASRASELVGPFPARRIAADGTHAQMLHGGFRDCEGLHGWGQPPITRITRIEDSRRIHSVRKATTGSTPLARRAGTIAAITAMTKRMAAVVTRVSGSRGVTP